MTSERANQIEVFDEIGEKSGNKYYQNRNEAWKTLSSRNRNNFLIYPAQPAFFQKIHGKILGIPNIGCSIYWGIFNGAIFIFGHEIWGTCNPVIS